jgi:hypothetical protein
MQPLARSSGGSDDQRLARLCALLLAVGLAWTADSYEGDLNVARPAVLGVAAPTPASQADGGAARLVWILVDGLRRDASQTMPVLNRLRAEGLDVAGRAEFPSFSGPNFVAQASGIEPAASGVLANGYPGEVALDSVFRRAKLAGLRTAVVTTDHDSGLRDLYASWIDENWIGDSLERIPSADLVLVHDGRPDEAAHRHGARSPEYRAAVARADDVIGRVVGTLDPLRDTIVVSSDHGHLDEGGHGGTEPEVLAIPIVLWGAGIEPGRLREFGRARDVGPTIAVLLGVGPLRHATGRPLVGGDRATAEQRAAVHALVGAAGWRRTSQIPPVLVVAVGALALLARRVRVTPRALVAAPTYAFVVAELLIVTQTLSFSVTNDTAEFSARIAALLAFAGLAQLLVGGRASMTPAAVATSIAVLAVVVLAAFEPLPAADGTLRFLPVPALASLAFICLMRAVIGTPEMARPLVRKTRRVAVRRAALAPSE